MKAVFTCILFWVIALWGETYLFLGLSWFNPALFFLFATLFCLHWRGPEGYFISLLFGLSADAFSSLPFGLYGLVFFSLSFFTRWFAIKVFQDFRYAIPLMVAFLTLVMDLLIYLLLSFMFKYKPVGVSWMRQILLNQALVTALLSVPFYRLLVFLEEHLKLRLAERKF